MDVNQEQYKLILSQGLIPKARLDSAFSHPDRRIYNDFCDFLIHSMMLRADLGLKIRQEANLTQKGNSSSRAASSFKDLESFLQSHCLNHPLFSPLARIQYELLEKLGEGGMGVVHRIKDKKLGRSAALKVLASVNNERAVARFIREARITASLVHPNIPPIYELGMNSSGEHYMLMKVIEGQSLRQAIGEIHGGGKADPKETRRLLEALVKVCEAMAYAHSKNVIHRDLKPENIMIGEFGEVMVLDWGLARQLDDEDDIDLDNPESLQLREAAQKEGLTGAGDLLGTVGYMAPEQIDGQACKQSDVFALGAILTEILTGKRAIEGDGVIPKLSATIQGRIRGPRQLSKDTAKELNALAISALHTELKDRLKSVGDFGADLKAYLSGEKLGIYHYSFVQRSMRWWSRRPTMLMAALLFLILGSIAISFQLKTKSVEQERRVAEQVQEQAEQRKARIEKALRLFNDAENASDRGLSKAKLKKLIEEALELGENTDSMKLRAGKIYFRAKAYQLSLEILGGIQSSNAVSIETLFLQHRIEKREETNTFVHSQFLVELLNTANELGMNNEFTIIAQCILAGTKGDWPGAEKIAQQSGDWGEPVGRYFGDRAFKNSLAGHYKEAIRDFNFAILADSRNSLYYMRRGRLKDLTNQFQEALEDYTKGLALDKKRSKLFFFRGVTYTKLKQYKLAIKDYTRALELAPYSTSNYYQRGQAYYSLGQYEEAQDDFENLLSRDPDWADAHYYLGEIEYNRKHYDTALEHYENASLRSPDSPWILEGLGRAHLKLRQYKRAIASLNIALEKNPKNDLHLGYRGTAKWLSNDIPGALKDFNKAITINPQRYTLYYHRGEVYRSVRRDKEAALDYEQCLRIDPQSKTLGWARGYITKHLGRPSQY